jgi:hypothetical protein
MLSPLIASDCMKFKHTSLSFPQPFPAKFSRHKPLAARFLPCKTDQYLNYSRTFLAFSFHTPHFDDTSPPRPFSWRSLCNTSMLDLVPAGVRGLRNEDNDEPRLACRWQPSREARPLKCRAFLYTGSFLILAAFTSFTGFNFCALFMTGCLLHTGLQNNFPPKR